MKELFSKEQIRQRVIEMANSISEDYKGKDLVVVVLLRGSFIFAADLVRELKMDVVIDFMVVSSYEGEESSGEVKVLKDLAESIHDRDVLIVEDIVDTGLTLNKIMMLFSGRNPKSLAICSMLDKPSRRIKPVHIDYTGFTVDDEFVVGYGLDMDQKYRQLPFIGVIET